MTPSPVRPIALSEIEAARTRIAGTVIRTPLIRLELGSEFPEIRLKLENLQPINAYKLRGAANAVAMLEKLGLASAYHALRGERQGEETVPTLYWRDRKKDGPTYHIDYIFVPAPWLGRVRELAVGTYEDWCGSGLSDHVPMMVDITL